MRHHQERIARWETSNIHPNNSQQLTKLKIPTSQGAPPASVSGVVVLVSAVYPCTEQDSVYPRFRQKPSFTHVLTHPDSKEESTMRRVRLSIKPWPLLLPTESLSFCQPVSLVLQVIDHVPGWDWGISSLSETFICSVSHLFHNRT